MDIIRKAPELRKGHEGTVATHLLPVFEEASEITPSTTLPSFVTVRVSYQVRYGEDEWNAASFTVDIRSLTNLRGVAAIRHALEVFKQVVVRSSSGEAAIVEHAVNGDREFTTYGIPVNVIMPWEEVEAGIVNCKIVDIELVCARDEQFYQVDTVTFYAAEANF